MESWPSVTHSLVSWQLPPLGSLGGEQEGPWDQGVGCLLRVRLLNSCVYVGGFLLEVGLWGSLSCDTFPQLRTDLPLQLRDLMRGPA